MRFCFGLRISIIFAGLLLLTPLAYADSHFAKLIEERMAESEKHLNSLRKTSEAVNEDPRFDKYYRQCPAPHFGAEKSRMTMFFRWLFEDGESLDTFTCSMLSEVCLESCQGGDADACFHLGLALQEKEDAVGKAAINRAFSLGCAAGSAPSCTNRGASMRNALKEDDPLAKLSEPIRNQCQFELFKIACGDKDPWGCAMLGQAYLLGEGVAADKEVARDRLKQSCEITDSDPCRYAKDLLSEYQLDQE